MEKILYMVTELISMVEQEKHCSGEMEKVFTLVSAKYILVRSFDYYTDLRPLAIPPKVLICVITNQVSQQRLRVQLIQAAKESRKGQTPH